MGVVKDITEEIIRKISVYCTVEQVAEVQGAITLVLYQYEISKKQTAITEYSCSGLDYVNRFLVAKEAAGIAPSTIDNYRLTLEMFFTATNKSVNDYRDDDIIYYLEFYRRTRQVSFVRIKNMQSALSSFWTWLYKKGYVKNNPVAQMDSVKLPKRIKQPFSDEERELPRMSCEKPRDFALVEFLYTTGVRVSELVSLNIDDISMTDRSLMVYGKGGKEREIYISAAAMVHLKTYLDSRTDDNPALFVSLKCPYERLSKKGIEDFLKKLGKKAGVKNVHPHRFRRTMATNALNRGMPIEQVSGLLGHTRLDTTQIYCTTNQQSIRHSHQKYCA